MDDKEWLDRVDPSQRFLMEKDAFHDFVTEPITSFTEGLMLFVLKNLFVRIFLYDRIPPEKWTETVRNAVADIVEENPSELIFIPMLEETKHIYTNVIDKHPRRFRLLIPYFEKHKKMKFFAIYNEIHAYYLHSRSKDGPRLYFGKYTKKQNQKRPDWSRCHKNLKKNK